MKKILWTVLVAGGIILGIATADPVKNTINRLSGRNIFITADVLKKNNEKLNEKLAQAFRERELLERGLSDLTFEMKGKDFYTLARETLLSSAVGTGDRSRLLLKPVEGEMMIKPSASDSEPLNALKREINSKMKTILDVSGGILKEKTAGLNLELREINSQVQNRNLLLSEKLAELEKFQKELDVQRRYIVELEEIKSELEKSVGNLETEIKNGQLKVSFQGDILFNSGSHKLRSGGKKLLRSVLNVLMQNQERFDIFVAGHTDNVKIKAEARRKYDSNWDLSTYRAVEVVKFLKSLGLKPENLTAAGYGEYKPVSDNMKEQGRQKNRRVEVFLIPKMIKRSAEGDS